MLDIALGHAANGYHVLPVVPDGKSALSKHWQVLATRDSAAITRWWTDHPDANPAIHTGKSGVLIADLDVKNGAQGPETWVEWTASHQVDPGRLLADTPTGGRHLGYRATGEFGNRVGMLPGVDVRAGNGYGRATTRTRGAAKIDPTPVVATPTGNECRCGCGGQTGGTYRQGHDAKHVSILVSYVAAGTHTYERAKKELPSGALQVKFHNARNKLQRKAQARTDHQVAKATKKPDLAATNTDTQKES